MDEADEGSGCPMNRRRFLQGLDAASYLRAHPGWRPNLPTQTRRSGQSRMVDFLTFAGVDPASRGQ